MIQAIHNLTTNRIAWIAKYISYRSNDIVIFGAKTSTVSEFCQEWDGFVGNAFRVRVWSGPKDKENWYNIPLTCFVLDWYFRAIVAGNRYIINKFEDMLIENMPLLDELVLEEK